MPHGGRHGHTLRQLRRRIDEVLAEEQERKEPPPPPISEEHAALRKRIENALRALPYPSEITDLAEWVFEDLDRLDLTQRVQDLQFEERKLLEAHGADWRPYQL